LRLWPAEYAGQQVREWQVLVNRRRLSPLGRDGFGNPALAHTVEGPVQAIRIEVHAIVETTDRSGIVEDRQEPLPANFFLLPTALTAPDVAIDALSEALPGEPDPISRLHALCNRVRDRVDYLPGLTDAETTASEALARGAGVCQDHAHLLIAAARTLGFPARYVSGYLCSGPDGSDAASHAWAEVAVPDLGWVGFDAANRMCPDAHYVRVASGRDYHDAAPVRGLRQGGSVETLEVNVRIARGTQRRGAAQ